MDQPHEVRIPATILQTLVRDVWSPVEIKTLLTLVSRGGFEAPVREEALLIDEDLAAGMRGDGSARSSIERVFDAIEMLVARGTLLRLTDEAGDAFLIFGSQENRMRAKQGFSLDHSASAPWRGPLKIERPSVFSRYEQNIGLVSPVIADRIIEALEHYPEHWIEDAIDEAVTYNRRSWRYIQRILENWAAEGRSDETDRRTIERDRNRTKHLRGKYAHLFQRDRLPDL